MPAHESIKTFFKNNWLSIVLLILMLWSRCWQAITGLHTYNSEQADYGKSAIDMGEYLTKWHFIQATFENWESEFLQMGLYVLLTVFLYQKGSAESKDPDKLEASDKEPRNSKDAPWPVKKWGIWLWLYKSSLSIAFFILFIRSFFAHFHWSWNEYNEEQLNKGQTTVTKNEYIWNANFWFESFQNRQSEFLAVLSIVLLSIWLRQKWSPESKSVDAPYSTTGSG